MKIYTLLEYINKYNKTKISHDSGICYLCNQQSIDFVLIFKNKIKTNNTCFCCHDCFMSIYEFMNTIKNICYCVVCEEKRNRKK